MAEDVGISPSSVGRIWAEAGVKPHRTKGFKVSNDPLFEEKVTDIVGLYIKRLEAGKIHLACKPGWECASDLGRTSLAICWRA